LFPSPTSPTIRSITESVAVTPKDVTQGSVGIDQRVKDMMEGFWQFHLKWINDTVKEVRFSRLSDNF
jgi:virulence-associated protein VapD